MTCIAGIAQDGKVVMGGDSASVNGWDMRVTALPKVFMRNDMLIGYTSSFRMGQLLRHKLVIPKHDKAVSDLEYMVCDFVEAVRTCLCVGGYTKVENEREEGGGFLVGYKGAIYLVGSDFQVNTYQDGIAACGCGVSYALAVMRVWTGRPRDRIEMALDTAAYFSAGVVGPFTILEV